MYSPHLSDSDSFDSATLYIPKINISCNNYENTKGGMIFLEDSERAPEYLDLDINIEDHPASDFDEEVIVLGEKRPTYEEITLEEDDEEVLEKVEGEVDNSQENENDIEELLFNCPKCEKVFRVESLLKFHIRMHGVEDPPLASASEGSPESTSLNSNDESSTKSSEIYQSSTRKEKENKKKSKSKSSSHKLKLRSEKRLKSDKKRNICKHS